MNEMNGQRRHVMNDDILGLIFKYLDLKDLYSLQRVSQQFNDCVKEVLQKKTEVSVGFNDLNSYSYSAIFGHFLRSIEDKDWNRIDITPAITLTNIDIAMDYNKQNRFESIVRQFRGVKKLYLSSTVISFKTLQLFVNQWPQLEEVYVNDIDIYRSSNQTITTWTQLMSKVKHITIGIVKRKYMPFMRDIITQLPSLRSVTAFRFKEYPSNQTITDISLSLLIECLPENIQCLHIGINAMDSQSSLDVITSKCPQIRKLSVYEPCIHSTQVENNLWKQWFAMICDRLKALKCLKFILFNISAKEFAESIAKLKYLQSLRIGSNNWLSESDYELQMCFDTQEMAKYMQPMVSLKTLYLKSLKCSPNRWSNLAQMLPNVRQLTVDFMLYDSECGYGADDYFSDCKECFHRCMDWVSKMPKLKHVILSHVFKDRITRHVLELFAGVDQLSINERFYGNQIEVLIHFLTETLVNRRRVLRLDLLPEDKRELIQRMDTMNVSMPECVIVSNVSTRYHVSVYQ